MEEKNEVSDMEVLLANPLCTECETLDDKENPLVFSFQHSKTGVPITNRQHHLKVYPNVFLGSDAVTWLQGRLEISREDARIIASEMLVNQVFSHVSGKKKFIDGYYFYRLAKHDVSERFKPEQVPENEMFYLGVHGFKGCPFCKRAIEAAEALQQESPENIVVEAIEHENRMEYTAWLKEKRNELSKNYSKVAYHTSSPIVYTTNSNMYIGGLDEMITFLQKMPRFKNTKALRKYQVESPVSTFVKGLPTIAKNLKATLPF